MSPLNVSRFDIYSVSLESSITDSGCKSSIAGMDKEVAPRIAYSVLVVPRLRAARPKLRPADPIPNAPHAEVQVLALNPWSEIEFRRNSARKEGETMARLGEAPLGIVHN
jgi:hypothetical protein